VVQKIEQPDPHQLAEVQQLEQIGTKQLINVQSKAQSAEAEAEAECPQRLLIYRNSAAK
jgi:hypothetical protein